MDALRSLVEAERLLELESEAGEADAAEHKEGDANLDSSMEEDVRAHGPPASSIGGLEVSKHTVCRATYSTTWSWLEDTWSPPLL